MPDYCTMDFKLGTYTVTIDAGGGYFGNPTEIDDGFSDALSLSNGVSVPVHAGNTLNLTPNQKYMLSFDYWSDEGSVEFDVDLFPVYNENGYRYEGSDPSNYIYMTNKSTNTNELWRIIGVFPDGENGEEIIRVRRHYEQNSYPTMAYDSGGTAYSYKNHWPWTTMYSTLSSTYFLSAYTGTVNFKMYLGATDSKNSTADNWYNIERGSTRGATASFCGSVLFTGPVGLMYPSDYGYGVLASDCARTTDTFYYNKTTTCYSNNWLFQGTGQDQWLINPTVSYESWVFRIYSGGSILYDSFTTGNAKAYSPVMALSSGVIVMGSGTKADPYTIVN